MSDVYDQTRRALLDCGMWTGAWGSDPSDVVDHLVDALVEAGLLRAEPAKSAFVVKDDCCGGCGTVRAVFSTRPVADAYVTAESPHTSLGLFVEEHELDEELMP